MKKQVYLIFFLFILSFSLLAQVTSRADYHRSMKFAKPLNRSVMNQLGSPMKVDSLASLNDIATYLFGPGVAITNLTYSGPAYSIGTFTDSTHTFGIDTGIVMTTGSLTNVLGPNNSPSASFDNGLPGDADLDSLIPGYTSYDASVIEFDFTPQTDTLIAAKFIFASEEYLEFVGSVYNDVFGFFISGPGFNGNENIAVIDTTHTNICINTINDLSYPQYYVNNDTGQVVQYDGYTTVIQAMHNIIPGQSYHFKIAIADAGDHIYDAGVFLKAGSFLSYAMMPTAGFEYLISGNTVSFQNRTNYAKEYLWDFGDGTTSTDYSPSHTFTNNGTYNVSLTARNYYQTNTYTESITIGSSGINVEINSPKISLTQVEKGLYKLTLNHGLSGEAALKIYSVSGTLVFSDILMPGQKEQTVDLRNYAPGIYTVQVISQGNVSVKKAIR